MERLLCSDRIEDVREGLSRFRRMAEHDRKATCLEGSGLEQGMQIPPESLTFYSFRYGGLLAEANPQLRSVVALAFLGWAVSTGRPIEGWTQLGAANLLERYAPGAGEWMGLSFEALPPLAELVPDISLLADLLAGLVVKHNTLLTRLPREVYACRRLRHVDLSSCGLTECPEVQHWPELRTLHLHGNALQRLSPALGDLPELTLLDAGLNWLTELPEDLMRATRLQHLELGPLEEVEDVDLERLRQWASEHVGYLYIHES